MTPLVLILVVLMFAGVLGSIRLLSRRRPGTGRFEPRVTMAALASAKTYRPLGRLFSAEDSAFLARAGGGKNHLVRKLGTARGRVLRLYLGQIRSDFNRLWCLARDIAPYSANPDFAALLARQFVTFHVVLALVHFRSRLGWHLPVPVHVDGLISSLEALRRSVAVVVNNLDSSTRQRVLGEPSLS